MPFVPSLSKDGDRQTIPPRNGLRQAQPERYIEGVIPDLIRDPGLSENCACDLTLWMLNRVQHDGS